MYLFTFFSGVCGFMRMTVPDLFLDMLNKGWILDQVPSFTKSVFDWKWLGFYQ